MSGVDQKRLKQTLGVTEWDDVNEGMGSQIIEQIVSGVISKDEWDYLKIVVPKFMDVVSSGLTTIGSLATSLAAVQTEALKTITEGIRAARKIAESSDDPAVKMRAFETIDKGFKKAAKMSKENGPSWSQLFGIVGAGIVGAAGMVAIVRKNA